VVRWNVNGVWLRHCKCCLLFPSWSLSTMFNTTIQLSHIYIVYNFTSHYLLFYFDLAFVSSLEIEKVLEKYGLSVLSLCTVSHIHHTTPLPTVNGSVSQLCIRQCFFLSFSLCV
jgi:hypothetical protein